MKDNKTMFLTSINSAVPKEGDGGEDGLELEELNIRVVSNGWVIQSIFDDESEMIEVFDNIGKDDGGKQALDLILTRLGLRNKVVIKK